MELTNKIMLYERISPRIVKFRTKLSNIHSKIRALYAPTEEEITESQIIQPVTTDVS
jgi:hypothetical protein